MVGAKERIGSLDCEHMPLLDTLFDGRQIIVLANRAPFRHELTEPTAGSSSRGPRADW